MTAKTLVALALEFRSAVVPSGGRRAVLAALLAVVVMLMNSLHHREAKAQVPAAPEARLPETDDDIRPVPELPETIVRGRPQPFPQSPLAEGAVLSATGTATDRRQVASSVTVIDEPQLRAQGRVLVSEVLRQQLGVDVARQGGPGGVTSVFMRGANSQHTKVLLDGIPLNDPSNPTRGFDFSTLTTDLLERVEILRGPQSLLYGSDAMGGVINLVTRRGQGPLAVRVTAEGGAYGSGRVNMLASGGTETAYYSIGGGYFEMTGVSAASEPPGNLERDSFSVGDVTGRFGWTPSDRLAVDYVFRYVDTDAEVDDFDFETGVPTDNLLRHNRGRQFYQRIQLASEHADGMFRQQVALNFTNYVRRDTDPEPFVPDEFLGQTREVTYVGNLAVTQTNTLTAGANYLAEDAATTFDPQVSQALAGVYVQDEQQVMERWFVTAGLRWDDTSRAGTAQTYRVTNLLRFDETGTAVHGTIGRGFRMPSLAENLFQYGNPDLRPERSKGWDLGVEQRLAGDRLLLDVTYFRNDFQDLIVFDFETFRLENVGQTRSTGVECTAAWQWSERTTVGGNYTYTDPRNLDDDTWLLRRARNKANLFVQREARDQRLTVRSNLLFVGPRLDTGNTRLHDYFLLDVSGSYSLTDSWQAFLRLENILDQDYEEVRGYGVLGFAGYAGMTFQR